MQEELFTLPATNIAQLELFGSKAHSDESKPQVKKCSKCLQLLHISAFRSRDRGAYLRTECKNCNSKLDQERKLLKDKYAEELKSNVEGRGESQYRLSLSTITMIRENLEVGFAINAIEV